MSKKTKKADKPKKSSKDKKSTKSKDKKSGKSKSKKAVTTTKTEVKKAASKTEVVGKSPFKTTYKSTEDMVDTIHELTAKRSTNEAHLSYVLWTLEQGNAWKTYGDVDYDNWPDFVRDVLKLSIHHVNSHIKNWQFMDQIGMQPGDLEKYDFAKLKLLTQLFDHVSSKELRTKWLPRAASKGSESRTVAELTEQVDEKVKKARKSAGGGSTSISLKLPANERQVLSDNLDQLASMLKTDTGMAALQAIASYALDNQSDADQATNTADALVKTKERVEAAVPGTKVVYFGGNVVSYNVYVFKNKDTVTAVVAPSEEIAQALAGGDVAEIPVLVSDMAAEKAYLEGRVTAKPAKTKKEKPAKTKKEKEGKKAKADKSEKSETTSKKKDRVILGVNVPESEMADFIAKVKKAPKSDKIKSVSKGFLKDAIAAQAIEKGTKLSDVIAAVTEEFAKSGVDVEKSKAKKVAWAFLKFAAAA